MGVTIITPPTAEPVMLLDLRAWCNYPSGDFDGWLHTAALAARQHVESLLGRTLMTTTLELTMRCFPDVVIALPRPPLQSVVSITYRNPCGDIVVMDGADFLVDTASVPGSVEPMLSSWPRTGDYPDAVAIRYVAGYSSAYLVPEPIKTAIKVLTAEMLALSDPDNSITKVVTFDVESIERDPRLASAAASKTVQRLLAPHRVYREAAA